MKCFQHQGYQMIVCWIIVSSLSSVQALYNPEKLYRIKENGDDNGQVGGRENWFSTDAITEYIYKNKEMMDVEYNKMRPRKEKRNHMFAHDSFNNVDEFSFPDELHHYKSLKHKRHRKKKRKRRNKKINYFVQRGIWENEDTFVPYNFRVVDKRNEKSLPDCDLTQLMTYIARLQIVNPESIIKLASEKDVDATCKTLEENIKDIDTYLTTCKPPQEKELYMKLINGIRTLDGKICKDEKFKKEFTTQAPCFSNLTQKYNTCVGPADWLEDPNTDQVCKTFRDIESCYINKTEESCGHDGVMVMKDLVNGIIKSVLTVDCNATTTNTSAGTSANSNTDLNSSIPSEKAESETSTTPHKTNDNTSDSAVSGNHTTESSTNGSSATGNTEPDTLVTIGEEKNATLVETEVPAKGNATANTEESVISATIQVSASGSKNTSRENETETVGTVLSETGGVESTHSDTGGTVEGSVSTTSNGKTSTLHSTETKSTSSIAIKTKSSEKSETVSEDTESAVSTSDEEEEDEDTNVEDEDLEDVSTTEFDTQSGCHDHNNFFVSAFIALCSSFYIFIQ